MPQIPHIGYDPTLSEPDETGVNVVSSPAKIARTASWLTSTSEEEERMSICSPAITISHCSTGLPLKKTFRSPAITVVALQKISRCRSGLPPQYMNSASDVQGSSVHLPPWFEKHIWCSSREAR